MLDDLNPALQLAVERFRNSAKSLKSYFFTARLQHNESVLAHFTGVCDPKIVKQFVRDNDNLVFLAFLKECKTSLAELYSSASTPFSTVSCDVRIRSVLQSFIGQGLVQVNDLRLISLINSPDIDPFYSPYTGDVDKTEKKHTLAEPRLDSPSVEGILAPSPQPSALSGLETVVVTKKFKLPESSTMAKQLKDLKSKLARVASQTGIPYSEEFTRGIDIGRGFTFKVFGNANDVANSTGTDRVLAVHLEMTPEEQANTIRDIDLAAKRITLKDDTEKAYKDKDNISKLPENGKVTLSIENNTSYLMATMNSIKDLPDQLYTALRNMPMLFDVDQVSDDFLMEVKNVMAYEGLNIVELLMAMADRNSMVRNDDNFAGVVLVIKGVVFNTKYDRLEKDMVMLSAIYSIRGTNATSIKRKSKEAFVAYFESLLTKYVITTNRKSSYGPKELTLGRVPAFGGLIISSLAHRGVGNLTPDMTDIRTLSIFPFLNHNAIAVTWPMKMDRCYVYLQSYRMDLIINKKNKDKKSKRVRRIIQYADAAIDSTFFTEEGRMAVFINRGVIKTDGRLSDEWVVIQKRAKKAWKKVIRDTNIPMPSSVEEEMDEEEGSLSSDDDQDSLE